MPARSIINLSAAFIVLAGLAAADIDARAQGTLSREEIRALVDGKTYRFEVPQRGFARTTTIDADGAQALTSNIPGIETDTGSWRIAGNELCSRWTKIRNGDESCQTVTPQSDTRYETSNGTILIFD
ncbi:hypothetical protein [Salinarimonas ramus]|uniref:Uncharacterized protein n=1 Tax=Salinarimonas ramus TaxID=690164 RepID=A0A917Q3P5_9HYPH|nr:hypothetical protein [Salinarimonas ramus]GGK18215.1 hypothetical protein GCM10011322_01180 [Salinarimonas ramus]